MTRETPRGLDQMLDLINQVELSTDEPGPGDEQFRPDWDYWTEESARQAGYLPE